MTFDKETYWQNRKAGKRGQGEQAAANVLPIPNDDHFKMGKNFRHVPGVGLVGGVNRKDMRKSLHEVDRTATKPNWKNRKKLPWMDRLARSRRDRAARTAVQGDRQ